MSARRVRPRSANARHHAEWLSLMDVSGPFLSLPVLDRTFPQELDPHAPARSAELRRLYDDWEEEGRDPKLHRAWVVSVLKRTLELPEGVLKQLADLPEGLDVSVPQHHETLKPDLVVVNPPGRADAGRPRLLIQVVLADQDLEKPLREAEWKASPATRMAELLRGAGSEGVRLGLVTNGEQWTLVYAPRGETAGYATWQAELWLEEPITLRAFRSLLGVRRFFGVPDAEALEALFEVSVKDQQEVTDRLGLQVRRAVEILVQAIDRIDQDRRRKLLEGFDEKQLYSAAVTVMMRLVFLLYAEEQDLLPIEDSFYAQNYAASTLLEKLQDDEDHLGEQVLERRHAAWNRLLATFRAVHGGVEHEGLRLPAYGGGLFDPDRYPFLEGRPRDSKWREVTAQPLPIDDATVLDLLRSLQFLEVHGLSGEGTEAQRLSFKALGVEQIGHVYESLLDHTAVRARSAVVGLVGPKEPEVELDQLESLRKKGKEAVVDFLVEETGKSRPAVEKALEDEIEADDTRWRVSCGNDTKLLDRVRPWAGLVREDSHDMPIVITEGSVYATKGTDRRSTGTHYTPRSLTEPIVQYTLEPLVYDGPSDGKPQGEWVLRSARDLLSLKVCDMACGSGAFLVQACRYLSERLVEAWGAVETKNPGKVVVTPEGELSEARTSECIIPKELDERLAVARRLVADRCLYGVDLNPMAVEMAKLSLWLVTLEKHRPFSFLDHAVKCGDSLLGITSVSQIKDFSLDPAEPRRYIGVAEATDRALHESERLRHELEVMPVVDIRDAEKKAELLLRADETVSVLRTVGNVLVGEALATTASRGEEDHPALTEVPRLLQEVLRAGPLPEGHKNRLARLQSIAVEVLHNPKAPWRMPFHWPLEFTEVFSQEPGFHAFLGNPPFAGGSKVTGLLGTDYRDYLVGQIADGRRGSADLCAYFFLRVSRLLRQSGTAGLLATKTIAQGDTREVALDALVAGGFSIPRAVPSRPWPGEAALEVAHVWLRKGPWMRPFVLDDREVAGIGPMLTVPSRAAGQPFRLAANSGKSYVGSYVLGMGFILEPDEAKILLKNHARNKDVVLPFLNGEDMNSRPDQSPSRWVINFWDWPLDRSTAPRGYQGPVAADYPDCLDIVLQRAKPERVRLAGGDATARETARRWWQFKRPTLALYEAVAALERYLVHPLTSKHNSFAFFGSGIVPSHMTVVLALSRMGDYAVVQSDLHWQWALAYGNKLETRPQYTPSDCFETFAFPDSRDSLDSIGARYYQHRSAVMAKRGEGLTKTYNRLHSSMEHAPDIRHLRELQVEMDESVAGAYGWTDVNLGHGFHDTKQGIRFTVSESARREVLDRLLELNHARHAQEGPAGPHPNGGRARKARARKKSMTFFEGEE